MKKILLSCVTCLLALGLVTACDDEVVEEDGTIPVEPGTTTDPGSTQNPGGSDNETTYYFGFEVDGEPTYMTGGIVGDYTWEGALTHSVSEAALVSVEEGEGENEYYLSYVDGETTKWITTIVSGDYTNLDFATEKSPIYLHTTDDGVDYWGNEAGTHFLCYYSNYDCLYASEIKYISSSPVAELIEPAEISSIVVTGADIVSVGDSIELSVTVNLGADEALIEWSSSDETLATVKDGVVTGVAVADKVTITASSIADSTVTGSIDIAVVAVPELYGTYDFSKLTTSYTLTESSGSSTHHLTAEELASQLSVAWTGAEGTENANPVTAVTTADRIDDYNSTTSGWKQGEESMGYLKTGSSSATGEMKVTTSVSVARVVINCHSWTTSSSNTAQVNGSAEQTASTSGDATDLTFDIEAATELDLVFTYRVFIASIAIYTTAA